MTNASESAPTNPSPSSEPAPKRFQCRHILTSGRRCRSASLRGEQFCYYHHTTRRPAPRHRGVHPQQSIFEMPLIDDREGIQFALAQILNFLTTGQLDPKRANPILYTLKLAIWNLHETRPARTSARTDSQNDSLSYVCQSPSSRDSDSFPSAAQEDNPPDDLVEDLILDPGLGPIAPIAEIPTPEAAAAAAQAAHDAVRAARAEALHADFARFQQENGFPSQPPQPEAVIPQPPQPEAVIPTGGGDFAAAVEGPPHFAFAVVCSRSSFWRSPRHPPTSTHRHPDRSSGRFHRPLRSGGTPAFESHPQPH